MNLENYETVKSRKKRFYADYPDGRIIVEIQNVDVLEHALFKATIFKTKEEQEKNLAFADGYAHEIRDKEIKISRQGKEYETVNYTSWVENCEESAIGRALDNAGYSGNNKCSHEEMQKVEKVLNNMPAKPSQTQQEPRKDVLNNLEYEDEPDHEKWPKNKAESEILKNQGLGKWRMSGEVDGKKQFVWMRKKTAEVEAVKNPFDDNTIPF